MKKVTLVILIVVMALAISASSVASSSTVPHFLNYQSLMYDDSGNLLPDGPTNITFKITDADGNILFEEQQTVDVVYGAASALIGNGLDTNGAPSGGIPTSILSPDNSPYLEVVVQGYPAEYPMEIVSVPFAVYAEKALGAVDGSIEGSALADNSIAINHFSNDLISDLADQMSTQGLIATSSDLSNLQSNYRSTSGAANIGVNSGFVYSGGANIQVVLQDLDRSIQLRQAGVDGVQANIDTVATNLATHEDATTGVHGVGSGTIVGTTLTQTLTNKTLSDPTIDGGTITSDVSVNPGVKIDGYDVGDEIYNHENRLDNIEGEVRPRTVAWGTVTTSGGDPDYSGYNISSITVSTGPLTTTWTVFFEVSMGDTDYSVTVSSTLRPPYDGLHEPAALAVYDKTASSFSVVVHCKSSEAVYCASHPPSAAFDFSVSKTQ